MRSGGSRTRSDFVGSANLLKLVVTRWMWEKTMVQLDLEIAAQHLLALEAEATPGPWTSIGHELYYSAKLHQQLQSDKDAAFIAVSRSWIKDLATEYLRLRREELERR